MHANLPYPYPQAGSSAFIEQGPPLFSTPALYTQKKQQKAPLASIFVLYTHTHTRTHTHPHTDTYAHPYTRAAAALLVEVCFKTVLLYTWFFNTMLGLLARIMCCSPYTYSEHRMHGWMCVYVSVCRVERAYVAHLNS